MTSLLQRLSGKRSISTLDDYVNLLSEFYYGGNAYGLGGPGGLNTTYGAQAGESIATSLEAYGRSAYAASGVVFACMQVRMMLFSAVRFQWQRMRSGRPGDLFGTAGLRLLESPWPGGTTQDLLLRLIQDADLAGNAYLTRDGNELVRLRPDWVVILLQPRVLYGEQVGWRKMGYAHYQDGIGNGEPALFLPDEVAHFAPSPDPLATYRGMSWLSPVISEITNDKAMNRHKGKYFANAATPNLSVSMDKSVTLDAFNAFMARMDEAHKGLQNAYKTLYLGGGADVKVIGADLKQMDFKVVQGHGETRIAAAANVPAVLVGLSEGIAASTYSNFGQARRRFADFTMHPLWANVAGSLEPILPRPGGDARLWYDSRDVPALREDESDAAIIQGREADTIRTLVDGGFEPESVKAAVAAKDFSLLVHTGLMSVQLLPPNTTLQDKRPDNTTGDEVTPDEPSAKKKAT